MKEEEFKKIMAIVLTLALLVLAYIVVRPILLAVLFGIILAYIFNPLYRRIHRVIPSENLSAFIMVGGVLVIFLAPLIFLIPLLARQAINLYLSFQQLDLALIIQEIFPSFFKSIGTSADITAITSSFTSNFTGWILSGFQQLAFNFPSILLQTVIILFTFFFLLRDYDEMALYFISISPFAHEVQKRFYQKFEQVTNSILYGQLIVGLSQGIIAGIGYFIFGAPNALLLTLITMMVGIIPVIGPWLVWVPVDIYLFLNNQTTAAIGLLIYGLLIINWVDNIIRPLIVSRMTKMNSAIALIGMIGGLYVFGIMGLIIGPLILAYLLLVAEFYKEKKFKSIIIEENSPIKKFPIP